MKLVVGGLHCMISKRTDYCALCMHYRLDMWICGMEWSRVHARRFHDAYKCVAGSQDWLGMTWHLDKRVHCLALKGIQVHL